MKTIALFFEYYKDESGTGPVLKDYSWWLDIVKDIGSRADCFEIRCWPDEKDAIDLGRKYGQRINNNDTKEVVFQGKISYEFMDYILGHSFYKNGGLKWFTLIFRKGNTHLFHSEHYGTEPFIFVKDSKEAEKIKEWSKQYPVISRVDLYQI